VFYGLDRFNPLIKTVIISHRELDAIALTSLGFDNVLAVPNGGDVPDGRTDEYEPESDRYRFLSAAADLIQKCDTVIFAFDDGAAGMAMRQELARRIGPGKCKVVKYLRGTLLKTQQEMGENDVCADINEAKPLPISGLYEIDDFEKELISMFTDGMASGVGTGWKNVDELYTVSTPGLTLVTGIPNSGKSEWIDALNVNLALNHGWKFAAFSPENGKELHSIKLIEKRVEMSADPKHKERMSFDTFHQGSLWVRKHWTFIESKDEMPTLDWILDRAVDAVLRKGIKGLIIDPWNRIEKKMDGMRSETDYVAQALPRILRFNANYGVHTWLVVHPKQQEKDRKTGKIPPPSLYDCAGSAHFVNMCDNGIVVHRADSVDDATEIYVNKVRFKHIGRRGNTKLAYDTRTGRYSPLDVTPSYKYGESGDGIKSYEPGDI
jgi:twinkle protein